VASSSEREQYECALAQELSRQAWPWKPETAYWGGGTPSLMPLAAFRKIMAMIPPASLSEVTLEAEPGTVTLEKAAAWHAYGVNRVSLGVQSFVNEEVRRTGRKHTPDDVAESVEILRRAGITNINLDLIAGLPGQTSKSWQESLDWLARLEPSHASIYLFEIDEDSNLGHEALFGGVRYGAALLPSDEATAEFYETAVERLRRLGLDRYEISNFAHPGLESRHNLKYWQLEPYLGFGVDAHSFDGLHRWANSDNVRSYLRQIASPDQAALHVTLADPTEERFFIGLRQSAGIEPTEPEWRRFNRPIQRGVEAGLLERDGARLRLTSKGFLVSNEVFQEFIS
jgi:oxygen-independent coproporphyrinogen-3 oxidase